MKHRDYDIPTQIKYRLGEDEILLISRDVDAEGDQVWTAQKDVTSYDSKIDIVNLLFKTPYGK